MKKIVIVERARYLDSSVSASIKNNLLEVLDDRFIIEDMYLDELRNVQTIEADIVLVPVYSVLPHIIDKVIGGKQRILLATRTFNKSSLEEIKRIKKGTDVLVVNVSVETTHDVVKLLYELGIHHLNLVPYEPEKTDPYHYSIAITPGEPNLVPANIKKIIDIGYRRLDTQTFLSLFTKLQIDDKHYINNLLDYIRELAPKNTDVEERFLNSLLLNQALKEVVEINPDGVLIVDADYRLFYMNEKVGFLLNCTPQRGACLKSCIEEDVYAIIGNEDFSHGLFQIHGEHIIITKTKLAIHNKITGYYINLRTASSIHEANAELSKSLRDSGLYARYSFNDIWYQSDKMRHCIETAKKVACTDYTILLEGETGTGKELFAQSIHNFSERCNGPFVAINCAALPENLLESELFGYERGAFTGSRKDGKIGLFEQAEGGTIFLDEISDISMSLQLKLLRVLQEKQIVRVGGNAVIDIDIRIIAATNQDLRRAVEEKRFRRDLYYRLSVFPILLPPLRERPEDILFIFRRFIQNDVRYLTSEIEKQLLNHRWDGNVRELRNVADYFRLMKTLPPLTDSVQGEILNLNDENLEQCVLKIVYQKQSTGVGRSKLLRELHAQNIRISEGRLESLLQKLKQKGYIERYIGRTGTTITEEGLELLRRK